MKQFFLQIYTNLPCSSRTIQSQIPFKYDICVFIAYALFQAHPIIRSILRRHVNDIFSLKISISSKNLDAACFQRSLTKKVNNGNQ